LSRCAPDHGAVVHIAGDGVDAGRGVGMLGSFARGSLPTEEPAPCVPCGAGRSRVGSAECRGGPVTVDLPRIVVRCGVSTGTWIGRSGGGVRAC
jgi:hypothetical protein